MTYWQVDYVVGNTYKVKYLKARSPEEAVKKARVKNIVDLNPCKVEYIGFYFTSGANPYVAFNRGKAEEVKKDWENQNVRVIPHNGNYIVYDYEDLIEPWENIPF